MKGVLFLNSGDVDEFTRWDEIRRDSLQIPVSWWEGSSDLKGRLYNSSPEETGCGWKDEERCRVWGS